MIVDGHRVTPLRDGWQLAAVAPKGAPEDPAQLDAAKLEWAPAIVPGTAASALRATKAWTFDTPRDFDASDWWWRCTFAAEPAIEGAARVLCFGGLATLADVFLNGEKILSSDDMFVAHEVDVTTKLRDSNVLLVRCRSLGAALEGRRPRPKWKTALVAHQQLRWFRTTLLGRIPGWSPKVAPVGPWRAITLEERPACSVRAFRLLPRMDGEDGVIDVEVRLAPNGAERIEGGTLAIGDASIELARAEEDDLVVLRGSLRVTKPARWWPATHGTPALHEARVVVKCAANQGESAIVRRVGFRTLEVERDVDGAGFGLKVNGVRVFCRGACWTTNDIVTLAGDEAQYRAALTAMRDAGMNMVRIGGTMVYEDDVFYDLCDELGILVWQDFMFANMDYPIGDEGFAKNVGHELDFNLARLSGRPCVAVLCGNSEIEQQVAMLGLPRESWSNALFRETMPARAKVWCPDVPYVPSSPTGGAFPFVPGEGITHYYGVGAYLRPLDDARRAEVRFTSECLGFANVPEQTTIDAFLGNGESPFHHPRWKARTPRDMGAGWDFEDVRDHYLKALFDVDPLKVRYGDMQRYLELSRVVTGEVMARVFGEWRRARSTCRGGLVWFHRDLWPGAGWGVVDSTGLPKAAYWYLKRAFAPVTIHLADEGLSGLRVHAHNDRSADLAAELRVALYRHGQVHVATGKRAVSVPARGEIEIDASTLFEGFLDLTYAYRFGPPGHDLVVASLVDETHGTLAEAFHFPLGLPSTREHDLGLEAVVEPLDGGDAMLTLRTKRFAQSIALELDEHRPSDAYFHLAPGGERQVRLFATKTGAKVRGLAMPLNAHAPTKI
jgi:beta-mannosidase